MPLEQKCIEQGLKMTEQRRVIAQVDSKISIATVYRTVRLFEEAGIIEKHDFGDGRARYEEAGESHHDHLIDMRSGKVIEFTNEEIERLQVKVAQELGYDLIDHRLELYCLPKDRKK
jgi:Fur family ferric uptake transcriptional regulator